MEANNLISIRFLRIWSFPPTLYYFFVLWNFSGELIHSSFPPLIQFITATQLVLPSPIPVPSFPINGVPILVHFILFLVGFSPEICKLFQNSISYFVHKTFRNELICYFVYFDVEIPTISCKLIFSNNDTVCGFHGLLCLWHVILNSSNIMTFW